MSFATPTLQPLPELQLMLPSGRSKAVPSLQRKEVSECNHTPRMNPSVVPLTLATHLSEQECHLELIHHQRTPRPPLRQSCNTTDTVNMPSQHTLIPVLYLGTPPDASLQCPQH